jgi:hypothetical protein
MRRGRMKLRTYLAAGVGICGIAGAFAAIVLLIPGISLEIARWCSLAIFIIHKAIYASEMFAFELILLACAIVVGIYVAVIWTRYVS